jgi:undecaprenyl pyrophosphate phosphatase UppP
VIILSDTFYEFADPLMRQLGRPTLFCHKLEADAAGFVAAFVTALVTVQALLAYVSRHSFTPFGWYRIVLGVVVLWYFW